MQIEDMMLAELEPPLRELFLQISRLEQGCSILRFLSQRSNVLLTADDLAYYVAETGSAAERDLEALVALGLVRRVELAGFNFYGFTQDCERRRAVESLRCWQHRWHLRLAQLDGEVEGHKSDL